MPLKGAWKIVLEEWKLKNKNVLPKNMFPFMLKNALDKVGSNVSNNIKAAFRACRIYPFDKEIVMRRMLNYEPSESTCNDTLSWTKAFIDVLKERRGLNDSSSFQSKPIGKRLPLIPGKKFWLQISSNKMIQLKRF